MLEERGGARSIFSWSESQMGGPTAYVAQQRGATRRCPLGEIRCRLRPPARIVGLLLATGVVFDSTARPIRGGRQSCLPPVWHRP